MTSGADGDWSPMSDGTDFLFKTYVFQPISISGTVFHDLDVDGSEDPGEPGLVGWTVYLDTNNNSSLDPGETSTTTGAGGTYTFSNLGPGTYQVRDVQPALWINMTGDPDPILGVSGVNATAEDIGHAQVQANTPPDITNIAGPTSPVAITLSVNIVATFTDPDVNDPHTCVILWDDSSSSAGVVVEPGSPGSCTGSHGYANAGVYTVSVTVTDSGGLNDGETYSQLVVVYDPNAGFVTGGGWIESPAGAYKADGSLFGKANFGFVSKYLKGATTPTGTTEFQFKAGSFNFHSATYQWLVVNQNGTNAQFKGTGTVNGAGNYGFMLWASDQNPDTFRIQIWDIDNAGAIVYDNGVEQPLGGGSIVIHK